MTTSLTKSQQLCADLVAKARSMNNNIRPITFKSAKGQEITVVALPMDFLATILRCDDQHGTIAKLRKALVGYDCMCPYCQTIYDLSCLQLSDL